MAAAKKAATAKAPSSKKSGGKNKGAEPTVAPAIKMTPVKKLQSLLASARAAYKDQREISGELGAEIKNAAEHDHLHKKAFAAVKSADRMEPEALADYFAHRDYYEECLGLRKRAGSVTRMDFNDDGLGEGAAADPKPSRASNVEPFPSPSGMAAE